MNDRELEARLRAWYRDEVGEAETAPVSLRRDVAAIPRTATNRSRHFGRNLTLLAAAALLLVGGALAAGSGLFRLPSQVPPEPAPSLAADATTSPANESSGPTAVTSPAPTDASSPVPGPSGSWIATGPMGTPRSGHVAVRLADGRVLVAGGSGANDELELTSAELYDPGSGTWTATGSMAKPLSSGGTATLLRDGEVLVVSLDPNDDPTLYHPASGTWTATGKMVGGDRFVGDTVTLLRDGKVLVAGLHGAQLYDPDSRSWTATGSMVTPRYNHTATLLPDGRVLVAGGDIGDRAVDSAELYDPITGSWTATASLRDVWQPGWRYDIITATLLQDGTVLVVRPTTAELYDPGTDTWHATRQQPRWFQPQSATLLSGGMVLVTLGGFAARTAPALYDPSSGSWTTTGTMIRWDQPDAATLLLDGTVLVAGGIDCAEGPKIGCPTAVTGSAELYIPAGVSPPPDLAPVPSSTPSPTPSGVRSRGPALW